MSTPANLLSVIQSNFGDLDSRPNLNQSRHDPGIAPVFSSQITRIQLAINNHERAHVTTVPLISSALRVPRQCKHMGCDACENPAVQNRGPTLVLNVLLCVCVRRKKSRTRTLRRVMIMCSTWWPQRQRLVGG